MSSGELQVVKDMLTERISGFKKTRDFFRSKAKLYSALIVIFSSLTTVLIGLGKLIDGDFFSVSSLVVSGFVTGLVSWSAKQAYNKNYVRNNNVLMQLYSIDSDLKFDIEKYGEEGADATKYHKAVSTVLKQANLAWDKDYRKAG